MPDFLSSELVGDRNLLRNWDQLPDVVRSILQTKIAAATQETEDLVGQNIEERLQQKSGRLRAALQSQVTDDGTRVEGTVFIAGVPYAKAQDTGATIPAHIIRPKNARVLAFEMNGEKTFATIVFHPGAHIPGVRYMKDAFSTMAPKISRDIKNAVVQGIRARMRNS